MQAGETSMSGSLPCFLRSKIYLSEETDQKHDVQQRYDHADSVEEVFRKG